MKIIVYAISKNEEKFVRRFMESMREADEIVVLDTGSTDKTVELLRECGAKVFIEKISPWRFDEARNRALNHVPLDADLCVAPDLDEVFEKGWRKKLEQNYVPKTKQIRYRYVWSHTQKGEEGHVFWADKIHCRNDFKWVNPVHEILRFEGKNYSCQYVDIKLEHFPDETKSRAQYLELLELSVKEQPENDRNMHYLGREYMYYGKYNKAIETLKKHLEMKNSTWKEERSASMRYIGVCYEKLNDFANAEQWFFKAIGETPFVREPFLYLADLYEKMQNYSGMLFMSERALEITSQSLSYINEPSSFGSLPFDLASIACFNLGMFEQALRYVDEALMIDPDLQRLIENKKLINEKLNV